MQNEPGTQTREGNVFVTQMTGNEVEITIDRGHSIRVFSLSNKEAKALLVALARQA